MAAKSSLPAYAMNRTSFPRMYEEAIVGPLFRPWAEVLLDRAQLEPGSGVLDVACGTGIVARLARQRLGSKARVVGVDVSAPMLEVAREIDPAIDWRTGDAAALPVGPDERFERVLCQQGIQFFADRNAAARELRRVLAPGGRVAAAVWRGAAEMPVFDALQRVAERYVGPIRDERYGFGDSGALEKLFKAAGFAEVAVDTVSLECRFPNGGELVRMNAMALLGMSNAPAEERERLLERVAAEGMAAVRAAFRDAALICETRSNVVVAS